MEIKLLDSDTLIINSLCGEDPLILESYINKVGIPHANPNKFFQLRSHCSTE